MPFAAIPAGTSRARGLLQGAAGEPPPLRIDAGRATSADRGLLHRHSAALPQGATPVGDVGTRHALKLIETREDLPVRGCYLVDPFRGE